MKRKEVNRKANEKLKEMYQDRDIISCEAHLEGCLGAFMLSWHHLHKRWWYIGKEELLSDFKQTILVCNYCHNKLEYDKSLHNKIFKELR